MGKRGFTLLELLMVVIIIGILAALALPAYYRTVERSRAAEVVTMLGQLRGAVQRACLSSSAGTYPANYAALDIENPQGNAQLTLRWTFPNLGSGTCNPLTFNMTVTRSGGPCQSSTVQMDVRNPPLDNPFIYVWAAGSPCA